MNLWYSDETYEDYYNEGRYAWSLILYVIVFVSFMSISIVNRSDHDCPYSLCLIARLFLHEMTLFLRETY
ncbi:unnamed protein product [Rotaria sordida]|uniref:Protein UNC80 central region domain-containing protein n=1 Tax=Rotaria sordida TaxID=392033 RepID=A0A814VCF8_9BILA|nr:unnamed protein product [Rotaria sordida]CAF1446065.1 unnamed protein product [Rotaria sordida]